MAPMACKWLGRSVVSLTNGNGNARGRAHVVVLVTALHGPWLPVNAAIHVKQASGFVHAPNLIDVAMSCRNCTTSSSLGTTTADFCTTFAARGRDGGGNGRS